MIYMHGAPNLAAPSICPYIPIISRIIFKVLISDERVYILQ